MTRVAHPDADVTSLDALIQQTTGDAQGDDEAFRAWHRVLQEHVAVPCDGFVIGEPISVVGFTYDGNPRRGVTARCRREDGSTHVVAACDVTLLPRTAGALHLAAYRKWLGAQADPGQVPAGVRRLRQHKATERDVDLDRPVALVVLSVKERAARCQVLGTDRGVTLRAARLWHLVPGEIAVVQPRRRWSYAGHPYLSGDIQSTRVDVAALGLVPLKLEDEGLWDPREHYWGEPGEPIEEWTEPVIARGARREFEMEQVLPGFDLDDPDSDPIGQSNDLKDAGQRGEALRILMELCQADLRCLDAHAHLGNLEIDHHPALAIRHYQVGLRIGELSLVEGFDGLLPWGFVDNRPFLRCMHGFGLCCWRLGRFDEAEHVFTRMLWLNPSDNQGARFLVHAVRARSRWEDRQEDL